MVGQMLLAVAPLTVGVTKVSWGIPIPSSASPRAKLASKSEAPVCLVTLVACNMSPLGKDSAYWAT